ncbi:hypothetical protein [Rubrobacter aplysinae]|uniref:hypothetical protein n=1 Tax=Rubrobacter aplysinae TaxID=909625 RepID=UPI00064C31FD|nr:hypothetical protein [Rubrobacter aplysinae]
MAQAARGSAALCFGPIDLLMVTTVAYLPFALPLLLPGTEVDPLDIARSLILFVLLSLCTELYALKSSNVHLIEA